MYSKSSLIILLCIGIDIDLRNHNRDSLNKSEYSKSILTIGEKNKKVIPVSTEKIIAIGNEINIHFVDAPLGKTPKEAWDGTLDAIVGAEKNILEKVRGVLNCWAGRIIHVGLPGSGHKLKLLNNSLYRS